MLQRQKIVLLVLCLFFAQFINMDSTKGIQNIETIVRPCRISSRATYIFNLNLELALQVHDWIKVIWPKETKLPVLPEDPVERTLELKRIIESIFIGSSQCSACQGLPEINYLENSIRFNIHLELNPSIHGYERINIVFTDRVGIINPAKPGFYVVKIATSKEQTPAKSNPYEIVTSQIGEPEGKPQVSIDPNGSYTNSKYTIRFRVGRGGELLFNQSRIRILFPKGTIFSVSANNIEPYLVKINGIPVKNKIMITEELITFISSVNIENSGLVEIVFEKGVGIINPAKVGDYTLEVSTSEDPAWTQSNIYRIEKSQEPLSVIPNKVSQTASYQFQFLLSKNIEIMDGIFVLFPDTVTLPNIINPVYVTVNKKPVPSITMKRNIVILFTKEKYEVNSLLVVVFSKECQIKNPKEPCKVNLGYKIHDADEYQFTSDAVIEKKNIAIQSILIEPPNAEAKAQFTFLISIEEPPGINSGEYIFIQFPSGTAFPSIISKEMVKLNDRISLEVKLYKPDTLSIQIPLNLAFGTNTVLSISKEFGISNPSKGNQSVQFILYCSLDPSLKEAKEVFMYPALPKTTFLLLDGKKGNNDWFTAPPSLSFSVNQEGCRTFFWWNNQTENSIEFVKAQLLPEGQYETTLYYYSESAFGKEETQFATLKVDTIKPILKITKPLLPTIKTSQSPLLIEGLSLELDFLLYGENTKKRDINLSINQIPVSVNKISGEFSYPLVLMSKNNIIQIDLSDEAGNKDEKKLEVLFWNEKPFLEFLSPKMDDTILSKSLLITGKVDPDSMVKTNGGDIKVKSDGSFQFETNLKDPGKKSFIFSVRDTFGNQGDYELILWYGYSITLQVNSQKAVKNGLQKKLDLPPFIQDSRTFVPFRFLGEELGASVDFEINPISKQVVKISYTLNSLKIILIIGEKFAFINENKVQLDTPPRIVKSRTVVPLRFMSESLGCKLIWDPKNKEILLQYPND